MGQFRPVQVGTRGHIDESWFEQKMEKYVHDDGSISALCIDVCGQYVPLVHRNDIHIVARILAAYHNDDIDNKTQVRSVEKISCMSDNERVARGVG